MAEIVSGETFECLELFDIRTAHIWSEIEIKCRNGLAAVHLVLGSLKRYARYDACSLDALGRT